MEGRTKESSDSCTILGVGRQVCLTYYFPRQEGRQKEEAQKCRERQERQEKLQKSEKARKKQRELYLKKTKRGQPVMKYRIDNLLGKLSSELQ